MKPVMKGMWTDRMLRETFYSLLTRVCHAKKVTHRAWPFSWPSSISSCNGRGSPSMTKDVPTDPSRNVAYKVRDYSQLAPVVDLIGHFSNGEASSMLSLCPWKVLCLSGKVSDG